MQLIFVQNSSEVSLRPEILERIVSEICTRTEITKEGVVSVEIVPDERIQELNREYRGIDKVTDVLSFSYMDDLTTYTDDAPLGDICMSMTRVIEQAKEFGHTTEEELYRLTVHGLLHILGHDHESDADYEKMWSIERPVLEILQREFWILKTEIY